MPLHINHLDAAIPTQRKLGRYVQGTERIFQFPDSEGDFISNGLIAHDQFTSVLDGDPVVKRFRNMTINVGHIVTPTLRCKGMYLLIDGDLTINGTLSMTSRGANAPGKFVGVDHLQELIYFDFEDKFSELDIFTIGAIGGETLQSVRSIGAPGANNACAGGGSGAVEPTYGGAKGFGAPGTSFSGGAGGGGAPRNTAGNGTINGGKGGNGVSHWSGTSWYPGGGGAGNPGGAGGTGGTAGASGTGGLLILIVKGNVIFGPTGQIVSAGSKGGKGYDSGGGSGGGAIHLFHKGVVSNPEKISAPGGAYGDVIPVEGYGGVGGRPGGAGSISINKF